MAGVMLGLSSQQVNAGYSEAEKEQQRSHGYGVYTTIFLMGGWSRHKKQTSANTPTRGLPAPQSRWRPGETQDVGSTWSVPSVLADVATVVIQHTERQWLTVHWLHKCLHKDVSCACPGYTSGRAAFHMRLRAGKLLSGTPSQPLFATNDIICTDEPRQVGLSLQTYKKTIIGNIPRAEFLGVGQRLSVQICSAEYTDVLSNQACCVVFGAQAYFFFHVQKLRICYLFDFLFILLK